MQADNAEGVEEKSRWNTGKGQKRPNSKGSNSSV